MEVIMVGRIGIGAEDGPEYLAGVVVRQMQELGRRILLGLLRIVLLFRFVIGIMRDSAWSANPYRDNCNGFRPLAMSNACLQRVIGRFILVRAP